MTTSRADMIVSSSPVVGESSCTETVAADTPTLADTPNVARMWRGRTPATQAEEYRHYLYETGIKKIASLPGNLGLQMMVSIKEQEAEFIVISYWKSIDAIIGYAGPNYTQVRDLPRDDEFLIDKERQVRHFDLNVNFWRG